MRRFGLFLAVLRTRNLKKTELYSSIPLEIGSKNVLPYLFSFIERNGFELKKGLWLRIFR